MNRVEIAIDRIKDILEDDDNYHTLALKLGGIWGYCDYAAKFRRSISADGGDFIEVTSRDHQ